ncbi:g4613 [Coccomyxa elongata]
MIVGTRPLSFTDWRTPNGIPRLAQGGHICGASRCYVVPAPIWPLPPAPAPSLPPAPGPALAPSWATPLAPASASSLAPAPAAILGAAMHPTSAPAPAAILSAAMTPTSAPAPAPARRYRRALAALPPVRPTNECYPEPQCGVFSFGTWGGALSILLAILSASSQVAGALHVLKKGKLLGVKLANIIALMYGAAVSGAIFGLWPPICQWNGDSITAVSFLAGGVIAVATLPLQLWEVTVQLSTGEKISGRAACRLFFALLDWSTMFTLARLRGTPALFFVCLPHGLLSLSARLIYDSEKHLRRSEQEVPPRHCELAYYWRVACWLLFCCCCCIAPYVYRCFPVSGAAEDANANGPSRNPASGCTADIKTTAPVEMMRMRVIAAFGRSTPAKVVATPPGPTVAGGPAAPIAGLSNPCGANMCFVNSVIQVLRRMPAFRSAVLAALNHQENAVLRALLNTMDALEVEDDKDVKQPISAADLRAALATLNPAEFETGSMGDVAELHRSLLAILDNQRASAVAVDAAFRLTTHIEYACKPRAFAWMQSCTGWATSCLLPPLGYLMQVLAGVGTDQRWDVCYRTARAELLVDCAPVSLLTLQFAYPAEDEDGIVQEVFGALREDLHINDICPVDPLRSYELAGIITYYGRHQVAYVLHGGQWVRADDEAVRVVGDFSAVRKTGVEGKEKPGAIHLVSRSALCQTRVWADERGKAWPDACCGAAARKLPCSCS